MSKVITAIHPSRTAPLCTDCKHYNPAVVLDLKAACTGPELSYCNHLSTPRDPVNGLSVTTCAAERHQLSGCGVSGTHFEHFAKGTP